MLTMKTLRLATLNLWHVDSDWQQRLEAAAAWAITSRIDVLCVQEIAERGGTLTSGLLAEMSRLTLATPLEHAGLASTTAVSCNTDKTSIVSGELVPIARHLADPDAPFMALAVVETSAGALPVGSVHLAWGSLREATRLWQAQRIAGWFDEHFGASETEMPAIVAGDFNAWDDSDTVRYMRGRTAHSPATLWTDAWDHRDRTSALESTSTPANPYAQETALAYRQGRDAVIDAGFLPERRIDYIFSRGWRHGRAFTPTQTRIVETPLMSDHYPVVTELVLG